MSLRMALRWLQELNCKGMMRWCYIGSCSLPSLTNSAHFVTRDPRQPAAPLRTHGSTHSDDITVVQFAPSRPGILLTASSDGLITLSNAEEPDEDEAVINVGNWGCSVSQAGWMPDESQIWAASDMETFSTWSDEVRLNNLQM